MLFVTSSHLDRLDQAHEENHARIGVQTNKVSTVDNVTIAMEGNGLRRSPMLVVSEKSAGPDSTGAGSPENRKSRILAGRSPSSI